MALTPEDVSNKRFTPVRLREGYDMGEVDQFLDEVEAELERLLKEGDDLRAKLEAVQGGARVDSKPAAVVVDKAEDKPSDKVTTPPAAEPEASEPAAPRETIKVVTAAEASSAALRLLELATKNADEVVAEAKEEAQEIVGSARTEAERVQAETKAAADKLEQEARTRAQNLDSETDTKRSELLGDMQEEKRRLDGEVDTLRAFEREYRSRLKSYFSEQLQALDGIGEGGDLPGSGNSRQLKSVLGEPGDHESAGDDSASDRQSDPPSDSASNSGDNPKD